ncbi:hypothetical protein IWX49DRAFT_351601 [Phyllosticta citricarpa]
MWRGRRPVAATTNESRHSGFWNRETWVKKWGQKERGTVPMKEQPSGGNFEAQRRRRGEDVAATGLEFECGRLLAFALQFAGRCFRQQFPHAETFQSPRTRQIQAATRFTGWDGSSSAHSLFDLPAQTQAILPLMDPETVHILTSSPPKSSSIWQPARPHGRAPRHNTVQLVVPDSQKKHACTTTATTISSSSRQRWASFVGHGERYCRCH